MKPSRTAAVILAAGKGTRMKSRWPKVMHRLAGRPMIGHVVESLRPLRCDPVIAVIAPGMEDVAKAVAPAAVAYQRKQLGTGHAVTAAASRLRGIKGDLLVLYGDTPFISTATLQAMLRRRRAGDDPAIVVLGMRPTDPGEYGRLVLGRDGGLEAIVEARDATSDERAIGLCNSGVMALDAPRVLPLLKALRNDNAKGEYYLTDLVGLARAQGWRAAIVEAPAEELVGVNSRADLAAAEALLQARLRRRAMAQGATLIDPASVFFSADTRLGRDVVIGPNVVFGPGVAVGDNVEIRAFCHIEGARIGAGAVVGPFARLRPGAVLGTGAHVGNFVEVKNARLAAGAKANHLTYLGDAEIGAAANIGAGTITANYDGFRKSRTRIGAGVSVGSNSVLVAPVTVGKGAIIGAGSVVTETVPADALVLARGRQTNLKGRARKFRAERTRGLKSKSKPKRG
ncbi:MAG: bifunctional UDP-N-acetylglucosamine diphosphorylase/glucosamine-1-phosphate N-acetyltransferase GlmU [Hyphomicrobium sp.]|uniref:bifunctional UDP-N-acetylglucosamine diphosphorylase/glucosamine-1-phosphate N-acetyltransferase GlmU n=1 Tax=Hyphomicrobium sp. TaxID=82 RepID=UPI003D0A72B0